MDMLDDDIVYLGSRIPQSPSTERPASQSPLTGIVLHVEKCGLVDAQRLSFNREDMAVVQIGRRSGFDPDKRRSSDIEQEGAMFRCAVVSRKHAKIAFSDSGAAYLIDLNSHHGTHVRRQDEKYMKMIKPESPTLLHDGDVITFGKTVGKNDEAVRPVTVRVELVYQITASSPSSSKPYSTTSLFSVSPSLSHTTVSKPSSGRYGVHNAASSSSDNESYSSDMYSEVDDMRSSPTPSPPVEEPAPLPPSESQNSMAAPKAKVPFNAVNLLRNLLPPLHPPTPRENLPSVADIMHRYFRPTPPLHNSIFDLPQPPLVILEESQPIGFDASQHDIYEPDAQSLRSRSESPMDLASTSPSPAPEVIVSRQLSIPPVSTPTPHRTIAIDLTDIDSDSNAGQEATGAYKPPPVDLSELYDLPGIISHPVSPGQSTSTAPQDNINPANPSDDVSDQLNSIRGTMTRLEEEVARLNNHRKKYKARCTSSTEFVNQKLGEFYDKVDEANAECTMLYDKVDTIRSVDIPDIQAQVDMLEERMDKFEAIGDDGDDDGEFDGNDHEEVPAHQDSENEDEIELRVGAAKVKALIDELVLLRDNAKQEVAAELESIRVMRQVAMADIEMAKAELAAQVLKFADEHQTCPLPISFRSGRSTTPVPPSLKRKRDDTDENEDSDDDSEFGEGTSTSVMSENVDVEPSSSSSLESELERLAEEMAREQQQQTYHHHGFAAMEIEHRPLTTMMMAAAQQSPADSPSPRKRARRVVSVVAQTATAVTIGAVVTWTALAFS